MKRMIAMKKGEMTDDNKKDEKMNITIVMESDKDKKDKETKK